MVEGQWVASGVRPVLAGQLRVYAWAMLEKVVRPLLLPHPAALLQLLGWYLRWRQPYAWRAAHAPHLCGRHAHTCSFRHVQMLSDRCSEPAQKHSRLSAAA